MINLNEIEVNCPKLFNRIKENSIKYYGRELKYFMSSSILGLFEFSSTKEGFDFWTNISNCINIRDFETLLLIEDTMSQN